MSYTALYRKLRPQTFTDVVGQASIVTTLANQITQQRVSHAYLFCGTRGTGKTSTAKIFARAINCTNKDGANPCGVCESCQSIQLGRSINVVEIDAASNNGVDNIRDIRNEIKYPPTMGTYRVYVIDEVHMLSTGAFNALLKTLEEPPPYVVFILATTDPQKIPPTVLSRVQRFDFRRITAPLMVDALKGYAESEHANVSAGALMTIASLSDGAMRDAVSLLDQCISFYEGANITTDMVLEIVGVADNRSLFALTQALVTFDSLAAMNLIQDMMDKGRDPHQFTVDAMGHFRNLLLSLHVQGESAALPLSVDTVSLLQQQAKVVTQNTLLLYVQTFASLQSDMKYASNPRMLLEVAVIKLCNPTAHPDCDTHDLLLSRVQKLEHMWQQGALTIAPLSPADTVPLETTAPPIATITKAVPEDVAYAIANWQQLVHAFGMPMQGYLDAAAPCYLEGTALIVVSRDLTTPTIFASKEDDIKKALVSVFEKEFDLVFLTQSDYDNRHRKIYGVVDDCFSEKDITDILGDHVVFN